jgi:hypothetical protein
MADEFKACSVDGCKGNAHWRAAGKKGYCNAHYLRHWRHGDPLGGFDRAQDGEPQRFYDETVLNYEGVECLIWPYARERKGYGVIKKDSGKSAIVSRRVCEEIHGPPPTTEHEAAHSCGNGHLGCVAKGHLSWKTSKENNADKISHGTVSRGESHPGAKITEAVAKGIYALKGKESQKSIAKLFGVSRSMVYHIHAGDSWSWLLSEEFKFR